MEIPTDEEIKSLRENAYAAALDNEVRDGYQSIVRSLIVIFVLAIVFALHWKLARGVMNSRGMD